MSYKRITSYSRECFFTACYWVVIYGALWWVLAGGEGLGFGLWWIAAASVLSLSLSQRPWRLHWLYLPRFTLFFLRALFRGGWDVARRALHPGFRVDPIWEDYHFTTADSRIRLVFSAMVGLLPGTLASEIQGDVMQVHVLDRRQPWRETLEQLEHALVKLLGER